VIIKICGITAIEDAQLALEGGANAIGFNFWPSSPRFIAPETARRMIDRIRDSFGATSLLTVGVLVGAAGWEEAPTDILQFHGLSDPACLPKTGRRTWVAVTPETESRFPDSEILIDGSGGMGQAADWEALSQLHRPFILAGGLTPENVGAVIKRLCPAGIDVCSGVEASPGRKDPEKLKRFLGEVKRATHGEASRG
jgi:phosphoribosylanthranilate isomerase